MGLDFNDGDIKFLLNKFDLCKEGGISFGNLFDMLVPFEKAYRDMVEKRPPKSCCPCKSPDIFTPDTIESFRNVFEDDEIEISNETTADDIDAWDSLTHVQLIVSVEKEFSLKFSTVKSVTSIKTAVYF